MNQHFMHPSYKDVCIEVLDVNFPDKNNIKLLVNWVVLGYTGNPWPVDLRRTIEFSLDKWKEFVNITPYLSIPRKKPGLPEGAR